MKAQVNLFFIFLVLIALAGALLFLKSGAIQYPGNGESMQWQETPVETWAKIHIVNSVSQGKESVCFTNLQGDLYNGAYIKDFSPDFSDEKSCPDKYFPVVSEFYVSDDNPCVTITDRETVECYRKYSDEEVAADDSVSKARNECLISSGSYSCKISDVQAYLYLTKKPGAIERITTDTTNLWLIAGILGIVTLFLMLKRR